MVPSLDPPQFRARFGTLQVLGAVAALLLLLLAIMAGLLWHDVRQDIRELADGLGSTSSLCDPLPSSRRANDVVGPLAARSARAGVLAAAP